MQRKRDRTINRESLKTLVVAFGPNEAARQANMNVNTVKSLSRRHGWKRATHEASRDDISNPQTPDATSAICQTKPNSTTPSICTSTPSQAISSALAHLRNRSLMGLATYAARAAEHAADEKKCADPLSISRKVKDVADVHRSIYPADTTRQDILQIGILIATR